MISNINSIVQLCQSLILLSFILCLGILCQNPCSDIEYYLNGDCYSCNVSMCEKCQGLGICQKCIQGYVLEGNGVLCVECDSQSCLNKSIGNIESNITKNSTDFQADEKQFQSSNSKESDIFNQTMSSNDSNEEISKNNDSLFGNVNLVDDEGNITNITDDIENNGSLDGNESQKTDNNGSNAIPYNETDNVDDNFNDNTTVENETYNNASEDSNSTQDNKTQNNDSKNQTNNGTTNETNVSLCQKGFTFVLNQCQSCPKNCLVCNNGSFCVECLPNYFFNQGKCVRCGPGCEQCSSKNICNKCRFGYRLVSKDSGSNCVQLGNKMSGIIQTQISGKKYWVSCGYGCEVCGFVNTSLTCMKCVKGRYLSQQGVCLPCLSPCLSCFADGGIVKCTSCGSFFMLMGQNCIECIADNCLSCSSPSVCEICAYGYTLKQDRCVECSDYCLVCNLTSCLLCQIGHVVLNNTCMECASGCGSCNISNLSECIGCQNGYNLIDGSCYLCANNCVECEGNKCVECGYGYGMIGGNCLEYCDDECVRCQYDVRDSRLECKECVYGYQVVDGKCRGVRTGLVAPFCLLNQYLLAYGVCRSCQQVKCEQCRLLSGIQVCVKCSQGYFGNPDCVACPQNCSICSSRQICNECKSGYYIEQYLNMGTGRCLACSRKDGCLECFDSASKCLECLQGYERVGFKCVTKERLGLWLHLDEKAQEVIFRMVELKSYILRILGKQYQKQYGWITVRKFENGSTILNMSINIPQQVNIEIFGLNILQGLDSQQFGFRLISKPLIQYQNYSPGSNEIISSAGKSSTSGIIVACVIGVILLIIIILIVCFKMKNKGDFYRDQNDVQFGSANTLGKSNDGREKRREERKKGRKEKEEKLHLDEIRSDNFTEDFN